MRARPKTKIRKSIRLFYTIIATVLLAISSSNLIQVLFKDTSINHKKELYSYTNNFSYDYKVNLINNKYIDQDTLNMGETYVTDLIDDINLNLNYQYKGNDKLDITYKYKIIGKLQGVYTKDSEEQKIWDEEEILLPEKSLSCESKDEFEVKEKIKLNLKKKNKLVKEFEQEMNMTLDAIYIVALNIETITNIENEEVKNNYTSAVTIDLAEKTTQIKGENNKSDTEYVTKEVKEKTNINVFGMIINILLLIISLAIYKYIFTSTVPINKIRNDYRRELNRMLRLCQDKIVQVRDKVDIRQENIVDVRDFGEIIKVSEELFKPILYWESKQTDEAWFSVMSNEVTYRFVFKNKENS